MARRWPPPPAPPPPPPPPLPPPPPPPPSLLPRATRFLRSFNCLASRMPPARRTRFDLVGASSSWPSLRSSTWS
eukprot:16443660-Heterocapsa_arctica.AAC.1